MTYTDDAHRTKTVAALSSVGAAIGLTALKIIVALLTGSLGILAEAAHSGLDLVAALMTFFAVRVADRPADATHTYGHSKVENLSAFLEAGLLIVTAIWVIYEAVTRLLFHQGLADITIWAFVVMGISIVIDFTRSRVLLRVARQLGSQALEADALHFSTDIWSSFVVILGLLVVYLSKAFHLPAWLDQADAVAALGVSGIVLWVSGRLARETIDALLDRAPGELAAQIPTRLRQLEHVTEVRRVRIRRAGNKFFADIMLAAPRTLTFEQIHILTEDVEKATIEAVRAAYAQGDVDVVVHVEPVATPTETVTEQIHYLAELQGVHAHDIHVREVDGKLEADFDLEVQNDMDLSDAHEVATRLEQAVLQGNAQLRRVTTHLEAPENAVVPREDVTAQYADMARDMCRIADTIAGTGSAHEIHLYRPEHVSTDMSAQEHRKSTLYEAGEEHKEDKESKVHRDNSEQQDAPELDLVLHTTFEGQTPLSQVHIGAEEIKRALRRSYPTLNSVTIHTEPLESQANDQPAPRGRVESVAKSRRST